MAQARDLAHRVITNTALPYDVVGNPTDTESALVGGLNVLTSRRGYIERRPGSTAFESSVTTFTSPIRRLFIWRRWAGSYFVMANVVSGSQSIVYKFEIGTDSSFVSLFTSNSAVAFDFIVSNNHVFFGNGTDMRKWDATTLTTWGITAPATANTVATSGTGITATSGFRYVFCYGNSTTAHVSSPSPLSASTGSFTNKQVDLAGARSTLAQVDRVHIYRTTDGGGGTLFEVTGSPIANPGAGNWNFADTTVDSDLSSTTAPPIGFNDPPTAGNGFVWFANRIWWFVDNRVYYTGWEEINNGMEEESVPSGVTGNFWAFASEVNGLGLVPGGLLVKTAGDIHFILGDTRDTFRRKLFISGMGVRNNRAIAQIGRVVAWLDVGDTVQMTDGLTIREVSAPITTDLEGITHSSASLVSHTDGIRNWLILADGGNTRLRVLDIDTQQWIPPWQLLNNRSVDAMVSGETAEGVRSLIFSVNHTGSNTKVYQLTPTAYTDYASSAESGTFAAHAITSLFDLVPSAQPGRLGELEYVGYERNSVAETTVGTLLDDDPTTQAFINIASANIIDAHNGKRAQGTDIVERWAYVRTPSGRRIAIRWDWAAATTNFRLYSIDLAFKLVY